MHLEMALSIEDVLAILKVIEESDCEEFHLELEGAKLVIKKTGAASSAVVDQFQPAASEARPDTPHVEPGAAPSLSQLRAPDSVPSALHGIRAPMVGTFYRSPAPGAPPYVDVGSVVAENDVIGILEVMKLMNSVTSGVRGRVVEICADNGALVEYDHLLMLVEPLESAQPSPATTGDPEGTSLPAGK